MPLRIIPTILLGVIVYFMVGLTATAANFFKFLLILVLYTIATTLWNFFLAAAFTDVGVAILVSSMCVFSSQPFVVFPRLIFYNDFAQPQPLPARLRRVLPQPQSRSTGAQMAGASPCLPSASPFTLPCSHPLRALPPSSSHRPHITSPVSHSSANSFPLPQQWLAPLKFTLEALAVNEVGGGLLINDSLEGVRVSVSAELIMDTLFGFKATAY